MLRSALLDRKLNQSKWRQILPELVFALNSSESKAIKSIPYEVVFGRKPTLPIDILFDTNEKYVPDDVLTPCVYAKELNLHLKKNV